MPRKKMGQGQECHHLDFNLTSQVLSTELKKERYPRWDGWDEEKAHYLIGQYVLLPNRLGGCPVYKQAETVGNESYFIFRSSRLVANGKTSHFFYKLLQ